MSKASAKPAGKVTEKKGTKKSTGPSLEDVEKLQNENETLRNELRVASAQVAYLRENLDPSAFRKAAGITAPDGTHLYEDALRCAEKMINEQKCQLEELQRNRQRADVSKLESELKHVKLDLEQTKQKLCNSLKEEQRLKTRFDEYHAKADQNNTNAWQSSSSESEKNNDGQAKTTWERVRENLLKQLSDLEKESKETAKRKDEKYDETLKKHKEEMEKIRKENGATLDKRDKKYDETLKKHQAEMEKLRKEMMKLCTKNTVVGAQIAAGDPNIPELSDENRPTKLAETYSEIYDNDWTDAYEDAEKDGLNEWKAIQKLLRILMDVDGECRSMANDFKNNIKRAALSLSKNGGNMTETKVDVTRNNLLKEMQKSFAPLLVEDVYKNLVNKSKPKLPKNTERFYRSCVELCWLMSVQDPPVVFDTPKTGGKFDSDRYRTYTEMGKQLDYVVWPPMLLHAGGPLLVKGVAQGK